MQKHDAFAALRYRDFSIVTINQFCLTLAILIQEIIVAYSLYQITKDPLTLGLIGLAEAIPFTALSLWGGYFADKFNKQVIMKICLFFSVPLPLVLWLLFHLHGLGHISVNFLSWGIYAVIFGLGTIRGFYNPSATSLKPFLIPRELYANGATWTTIGWQSGVIIGPMLGGFMLAYLGRETSLFSVAGLLSNCFILINLLHKRSFPKIETANVLESLGDGFRFIWKTKIVLWAISLDLASVLFGGVIALLPIFAEDILKVGPEGLGYLRAAPSIGALITMIALTRFPPTQHAWRNMLLAVAGFGIFTILFAFSKNMWLSLFALAMTGACDSISVVVRQTILQIFPPENMRGRVAAVNGMFVSSSNELGAFESGLAAKYLGTIAATIFGGCMTLAVVTFCWLKTNDLFKVDITKSSED
ncbi:nickel resistance MFS transporter NreB [Acinetobacter baumannii]|uniref:nickel resistance MFS transporter NreB n=1 Tax=Acinetobacter baumannii TaxID=470 RepID=UPI0012460A87|nr:nickel resistance MFS transporter NreB [Acinetobacter baumannii]MCR0010550.1 nickel resistance MFS transporter NreB [Acinetobacter baumannii]MDN8171203.1 nickel resistance MFS transporter NreB [Acinetobacter baumannii]MDQ8937319.1 nickel resistance MFS transporter NreB [Acinetobacter baumannii]MDQ9850368.1 nickel resistance MFS transporter NreB [Acinetobacter baumannii]MDQ9998725.1 nickel resistance MFS transporter NreB [Acinetobacter baumannii]